MGKIGGKIVLFYFLTAFAAIAIGIASFDVLGFKLGVPQKVYSLSIPLGATIKIHGTCII